MPHKRNSGTQRADSWRRAAGAWPHQRVDQRCRPATGAWIGRVACGVGAAAGERSAGRGCARASGDAAGGLEVYPDNMWRNLAATGGGIMAEPVARLLAPILGVEKAKAVSAEAAETSRRKARPYSEVLAEHPDVKEAVDPEALRNACDPALYLGSSAAQVTRAKNG